MDICFNQVCFLPPKCQEHSIILCYTSSLSRKNLVCITGPWTCVKHNLSCNSSKVFEYACSRVNNTLEVFPTQQLPETCVSEKWVGTRYYWFLDTANDGSQFPLYFLVLSITKMTISLKPYAQFVWGFQRDLALKLRHTLKMKTEF